MVMVDAVMRRARAVVPPLHVLRSAVVRLFGTRRIRLVVISGHILVLAWTRIADIAKQILNPFNEPAHICTSEKERVWTKRSARTTQNPTEIIVGACHWPRQVFEKRFS
jgi:hypothetical protein